MSRIVSKQKLEAEKSAEKDRHMLTQKACEERASAPGAPDYAPPLRENERRAWDKIMGN